MASFVIFRKRAFKRRPCKQKGIEKRDRDHISFRFFNFFVRFCVFSGEAIGMRGML